MRDSVYYAELDNGLTVVLIPKQEFHETYGVMTVNFGGIHTGLCLNNGRELEYPEGIAHFLEHKLFETDDNEDVINQFAKYGASANAYTSFRQTSYLFSTTQEILPCLSLLQSFVRQPYFTEENVERERGIIAQEIEMYQDDVDYRLFTGILASLYPHTSLANDIAGTVESIQKIGTKELYDNFEIFYHPSNMNLLLIGRFDVDQVWKQILSYQTAQMDGEKPLFECKPIQKFPVLQHRTEKLDVTMPKLAVGLRGNDQIDEEDIPKYRLSLQLLFSMLFGWTSGRYQKLYSQGTIDASFQFQLEVTPDYHYLIISADTEEPIALSSTLMKAISNFDRDKDVSEHHLELLKKEMYGDFLRSLNSLEFTASYFVSRYSDNEDIFDIPHTIHSITLADIKDVGERFISHSDMTDFMIFPK